MTRAPVPVVDVPEERWLDCGPEGDPSKLILDGGILIAGCHLHVEAHLVKNTRDDGDCITFQEGTDDFEDLYTAFGCDGPCQSVTIRGRTYTIWALPYSE